MTFFDNSTYSSKIYSTTVYSILIYFEIKLHDMPANALLLIWTVELELYRFIIMSSVLIYFGIEYHNMMYVALRGCLVHLVAPKSSHF
jgi:hypothetical protein